MDYLYVIEGSSGTGKTIQANILTKRLIDKGKNAAYIKFPNYESPYGKTIKAIAHGAYGKDVYEKNIYATSLMYSLDRFISFMSDYKYIMDQYDIIVCDQYAYCNMIYQGAKLLQPPLSDLWEYCAWLEEIEFEKLKLPRPTKTVYLHAPFELAESNLEKRDGKENATELLELQKNRIRINHTGLIIADHYNWPIISVEDKYNPSHMMSELKISDKIMSALGL